MDLRARTILTMLPPPPPRRVVDYCARYMELQREAAANAAAAGLPASGLLAARDDQLMRKSDEQLMLAYLHLFTCAPPCAPCTARTCWPACTCLLPAPVEASSTMRYLHCPHLLATCAHFLPAPNFPMPACPSTPRLQSHASAFQFCPCPSASATSCCLKHMPLCPPPFHLQQGGAGGH